jgi:hypothetical protein
MLIKRALVAAALLVLGSQCGTAQIVAPKTSGGCINVADMDARVTVTGRLTVVTVTDEFGTERPFILELPSPVCVDDGGDFADPAKKFAQVHVSGTNDKMLRALRKAVGRRVTVSGEGFAAHTRHHHRPLVVLADQITVR